MSNPTSQAVAKIDDGPGAMITKYRDDFAMVLPSHIKPEHWVRLSQGVLRRNRDLARVAAANPGSFLSALLDCARLGLEPGDTYHFVTFGNEVTGIADYTGLVELVYRAGAVSSVQAEIVYENDNFEWIPGQMERPIHTPPLDPKTGKPSWFVKRGPLVGAYAYAIMKDGTTSRVVVFSKEQIEEVRAVSRSSKSASSPWVKWYDRMALKTVVRQLSKWVPSSAEYREQVLRTEAAAMTAAEGMGVNLPAPDFAPSEPMPDDDEYVEAELVEDGAA